MNAKQIEDRTRRVIERRRKKGETLRDIVDSSGVSLGWLSEWLNGKIPNPGIYTLEALHQKPSKDTGS